MIGRRSWWVSFFAIALVAADAPDVSRPARPAPHTIRWNVGAKSSVDVTGIDRANLDALAASYGKTGQWPDLFSVRIVPKRGTKTADYPAMLGRLRVVGDVLRFEPAFPFEPGLLHWARFRPSQLPKPPADSASDVVAEFTRPLPPALEPASVVRVDPTGDRVPENLLKFYLHFSRPMSRGEAYAKVRLIDASGKVVDRPFLEIGEELWDPSGTRLTLLLDPGRIKRGLKPREEEGPILEAGKSYTLKIDRDWPDAQGYPLRSSFHKAFQAGPADETQPDPKTWTIEPPVAGTRNPLMLRFPEPLDRAMLERVLVVHDTKGRSVPGKVEVDERETRWRLVPDRPWRAGPFQVVVDTSLEDLAGNSIARPFEVDLFQPNDRRGEAETVAISFTVHEPREKGEARDR